jgi:hypothetical protein
MDFLKETAKSILVSQTIGKVINGDEADITKLRGTSHSTPKKPEDYTKNALCPFLFNSRHPSSFSWFWV